MMKTLGLALLLLSTQASAQTPAGQGEGGDWAFLTRYRAENASLPADNQRIVFMGDSITQGWANQEAFKSTPHYVGRGISGQDSQQMLIRFRSDVIKLKPAVVHLMAGTNDIANKNGRETDAEIQGNLSAMVELAQLHGIKVVMATIPPAADFPWNKGLAPTSRIKSMNEWIKGYAAEKKLTLVDYWPVLALPDGSMKPEYSGDGVHPNAAGYAAMRPLAKAAIDKTLSTN